MSLALYFDHNMPSPLVSALRQRGIDVITSLEDGTDRWGDRELWRKASSMNRIVVTQDQDFLEIAHESQAAGLPFDGLIFCRIAGVPISTLIDDLELVAAAMMMDELASTVIWIPL